MFHFAGFRSDPRGNDHFTSGENLQRLKCLASKRTLIGNRELANVFQFVTKELESNRVLGGGWENVENASTSSKFTTTSNHVDSLVGQFDQFQIEFG